MDLQLKNKVVLVTGGAKGIGAAIIRTATAECAIPVIVDRDADAAHKLHRELSTGDVIIAELSQAESCYAVIQKTVEIFGRLAALVYNAGINDNVDLEH